MENKHSWEELSETESNEVEELGYVPNFEDLSSTGRISENCFLFFDYKRARYILLNEDNGDRKVFKKEAAEHFLYDSFKKADVVLKNPCKDLLNVKKVFVEFDFEKDEAQWDDTFGTHINEFRIERTKLQIIKDKHEQFKNTEFLCNGDKFIDILNKKTPHIYTLLLNLFEKNEYVDYFINYLTSFIISRKKIRTAILFAGIEGAGKGLLIDNVLTPIFSKDYVCNVIASSLKREFNSALENKLIVNFNECASDFSQNDNVTQTLKSLITDNTFLLNQKGIQELQVKNNFLVFLSQNHKNAVKIGMSDRRFSYFTQSTSLANVVAEKHPNETMDDFVSAIEGEIDAFCGCLAFYKYNTAKANIPCVTENKKFVQNATNNNLEIIESYIKSKDFESIVKMVENIKDIFDTRNENNSTFTADNEYAQYLKNSDSYLATLLDELNKGYISNKTLSFLYSIATQEKEANDSKINKIFSSMFGDSVVMKINGKATRVRHIKFNFLGEKETTIGNAFSEKTSSESEEIPF